jgi:hypothetical protein
MKGRKNGKPAVPPSLVALRRAAKMALDLARQTGTSCWVEEDGKIIDIARTKPAKRKKRRPSAKRK